MFEKILKVLLQAILRMFENDKDLIIHRIHSSNSSSTGNNLMSIATVVEVEGHRGTGESYSKSLFIKLLPENEIRCEIFHIKEAFQNECLIYTKIFKKIPNIDEIIPKYIIGGEEMIVMGNLGNIGYKMANKKHGLDLEHSELVMKALGKLHASTFKLHITGNDFDSQLSMNLTKIGLNDSFVRNLFEKNVHQSLYTLRLAHDPCLEPAILVLEHIINTGNIIKIMLNLHNSKHLKVLCHGDFCINNMLFRYNGDSVESVKLLDFQKMCLGSPAVDLWTFFFSCITPELLNTCYEHLVFIYSSSFIQMLKDLDLSSSKIPKIEDIRKEIDKKEMYGFLIALMYISVNCSNFEELHIGLKTFIGGRDDILNLELPTNLATVKRFSDISKRCIARGVFSDFESKV